MSLQTCQAYVREAGEGSYWVGPKGFFMQNLPIEKYWPMTPTFSKCYERQTTQVELLMQLVDVQMLPLLGRGQDPTAPAPRSCLLVVQMGRPPNPWGLKNQGALGSQ